MPKITPFLWFDHEAEEAANYYISIFDNSRVVTVARYGEAGPGDPGSVMTVEFELEGQKFIALNGGPLFKFNESISFTIECRTQAEVDRYWDALTQDGEEKDCGWLTDRYGLSWQVTPVVLGKMLSDPDRERARRAMEAMLKMKKIEIPVLEEAYNSVAVP